MVRFDDTVSKQKRPNRQKNGEKMKIGIIGLGLIGGSLARAITARTEHEVYAFDIDEKALKTGALLFAYKEKLTKENAGEMDMIIIALYPKAVITALNEYAPLLKNGCIVMDCCGNKTVVVDEMKKLSKTYSDLIFIGAHPMAGREFSGIKHSTLGLYDRASMLLVPINADIKTLSNVKQFILSVGFGTVIITTAKEHDEIIAYTSQLAHIVSSSYIKSPTAQRYVGFSAGSFRDMTRVARLSPEMWSQLTVENSDNLVKEITCLQEKLEEYKQALQEKDIQKVYDLLADGNEKKLSAEKAKNVKIEN